MYDLRKIQLLVLVWALKIVMIWFRKLKSRVQYYVFDLLWHCVSSSVLTRVEARCYLCLAKLFVKTILTLGKNIISDENAGEMF